MLMRSMTSLRRTEEIDMAAEAFFSYGRLGLAFVSDAIKSPMLTLRFDRSGVLHSILPVSSAVHRQDMPRFLACWWCDLHEPH